jgi:hypothetical protein
MKSGALLIAALLVTAASARAAGAGSERRLVYNFSYSMNESTTVHNSGFDDSGNPGGGGTGVDSYNHENGTTGTITIDVQHEEADRGLVLTVAETVNGKTTPAAQCVVWGTGTMICDPNARIGPEEYTAVRFLGVNFVDPALIDANKHWHLASDSPAYSASSDYRIAKMDGTMMTIDESRKLVYRGGMESTADVTSSIVYDFAHKMPTSVDETTITHATHNGQERDQTVRVNVALASDSLAAKTP